MKFKFQYKKGYTSETVSLVTILFCFISVLTVIIYNSIEIKKDLYEIEKKYTELPYIKSNKNTYKLAAVNENCVLEIYTADKNYPIVLNEKRILIKNDDMNNMKKHLECLENLNYFIE